MQTSKLIIAVLAAGIAGTLGFKDVALAFDPNATPVEAFRQGYMAYKNGDTETALDGLGFAAEKGHRAAMWKLGQMYATGDGVAADDLRAFQLFSRIANDYAEGEPLGRDVRFVSRAFVALGDYYQSGIADAVPADQAKARGLFLYAASYFRDAEAQHKLADMYLNGQGGEKNARQAARWYKLAAGKGHAGAQAKLGQLMLEGVGVRRNTVKGLMWLSIARQKPQPDAAIQALHEQAFAAASEAERSTALALAQDWIGRQN